MTQFQDHQETEDIWVWVFGSILGRQLHGNITDQYQRWGRDSLIQLEQPFNIRYHYQVKLSSSIDIKELVKDKILKNWDAKVLWAPFAFIFISCCSLCSYGVTAYWCAVFTVLPATWGYIMATQLRCYQACAWLELGEGFQTDVLWKQEWERFSTNNPT